MGGNCVRVGMRGKESEGGRVGKDYLSDEGMEEGSEKETVRGERDGGGGGCQKKGAVGGGR